MPARLSDSTSLGNGGTRRTSRINSKSSKEKLRSLENSFRKSCEQIQIVNRYITALHRRYNKAKNEEHRSFRYSLRLRLATAEGVISMYLDYAHKKAREVAALRQSMTATTTRASS